MNCVWEHNGNDTLLYSVEYIGAFTRGETLDVAIQKMPDEINSYRRWKEEPPLALTCINIVQEKSSDLQIRDADSDVLFDAEKTTLSWNEYHSLKELVLKSALDFHKLYQSIPDKNTTCLPKRSTFYGEVPRTALEMYEHTKSVNTYYFGEIGIQTDNNGTIYECRQRGFELLEKTENYLLNPVFKGSYDELWSLRKVLRRFLWHDRIHAKAMYRMAVKTFGKECVKDPFHFL